VTVAPRDPSPTPSPDRPLPAGAVSPSGPPRLPASLVTRRRLLTRLDRLSALTIVEALPGTGKTTLIATWTREREVAGDAVAWIRASSGLDDRESFLETVRAALAQAGVVERRASTWTDRLARSERRVIVVVDDAHLLRDPTVADGLVALTSVAHRLHVVAVAGTDHHFGDAGDRLGVETHRVRGVDLHVAADELPAFAAVWGHELDVRRAKELFRLVGGWLLPIRLVLDATRSGSPEFATHAADEFLTERVIPGISDVDELSTAMLLAVPARLDCDLATALLDDGSGRSAGRGERAASTLERHGLLRPITGPDGTAWRFPTLLRRALVAQLERADPEAARRAHHVVSANGRGGELTRHARAAEDWPLLGRLWHDQGWSLVGSDPETFRAAYAAIPVTVLEGHPSLWLPATLGEVLASSAGASWRDRMEALFHHYAQTGSALLRNRERVTEPAVTAELLTAAMMSKRYEGCPAEARELGVQAAAEMAHAGLAEPGRLRSSQTAWFHLQHAMTQLHITHYEAAFEEAIAAHQIAPHTVVGAGAAGLLAAVLSTNGQTGLARQWLATHEAADLSGSWSAAGAGLPGHVARAMLALDRLDEETAATELAELPLGPEFNGLWPFVLAAHNRYALHFGDPVAMLSRVEHIGRLWARQRRDPASLAAQLIDRCTVDLLLAVGEAHRVLARLEGTPEPPALMLAPAARFHLLTGNADRATGLASAMWQSDITVRDRLELLVITALALREQGKSAKSLEAFRHAHALSQDIGSLQPFLLIPPEVRAELLAATGLELSVATQARLDVVGRLYPERLDLIELTPRELAVLREIARHETVAGVARALSVSVNTVKKQMVTLYAKLGVNDRSAALLRARELGITPAQ
jgi:LuxR family transcriptional regulator, maltose regulon positive regulatory protein